MRRLLPLPVLVLSLLALAGCAALRAIAEPQVSFRGAEMQGLSFQGAEFVVRLDLANPNRFDLPLAGVDWAVRLGETPLLQGTTEHRTAIPAGGSSTVELPFTIRYQDAWKALSDLGGAAANATRWVLTGGVRFDLPGGRDLRIPIRGGGELPMLRLPRVKLAGLRLDDLTAAGAGLRLTLEVDNPNPFPAGFGRLDWQLAVSGRTWTTGTVDEPIRLQPNERRTLTVPAELAFAQLGDVAGSVTRLLLRSEPVDFELRGGLVDLRASLPEFGTARDRGAPFEDAGQVEIRR